MSSLTRIGAKQQGEFPNLNFPDPILKDELSKLLLETSKKPSVEVKPQWEKFRIEHKLESDVFNQLVWECTKDFPLSVLLPDPPARVAGGAKILNPIVKDKLSKLLLETSQKTSAETKPQWEQFRIEHKLEPDEFDQYVWDILKDIPSSSLIPNPLARPKM